MKVKPSTLLLVAGIALLIFPFVSVKMEILNVVFSEDFESGTTTMGISVDDGCSLEVSDVTPINGVYSGKCYTFSQRDWTRAMYRQTITSVPKVYTQLYVRIDDFTPEGVDCILAAFEQITGETVYLCNLGVDTTRHLRLEYYDAEGTKRVTSTTTLALGTTYKVNMEVSVGSTADIKVFVNDGEVNDLTVENINNAVAIAVAKVTCGAISWGASATVFVDDLVVSATQPPTPSYLLSIDTTPVTGVSFSLDGLEKTTPYSADLDVGSYTIIMPSSVSSGGITYTFSKWNDDSTNPQKTITLTSDASLTATYVEQETPPPSGQGNLEVHAFLNETEVNAECIVDGTTFETTISGATQSLDAGAYTVTATYGNETLTETATITVGNTTRVDFQFTYEAETMPTEPIITPSEPSEWEVVSPMQVAGVGLVIAGIVVAQKERKTRK